jgi:hypothetical protein
MSIPKLEIATPKVDPTDKCIGMYEFLDALEVAIKSADPQKQIALAETIDGYAEDFPDDFFWAVGAQSPTLLSNLVKVIDSASQPDAKSPGDVAPQVAPINLTVEHAPAEEQQQDTPPGRDD